MIKTLECPDLTVNKYVSFFTRIKDSVFRFTFKWNEYSDCCFMSIFDADGNEINTGNALCNGCIIHNDHRILPDIRFFHKDGLTLEPTSETLNNYGLAYEDTTE